MRPWAWWQIFGPVIHLVEFLVLAWVLAGCICILDLNEAMLGTKSGKTVL